MTNAFLQFAMASSLRIFAWRLDPLICSSIFLFLPFCVQVASGQYRLTPKNTIGVEGQSALMHCAIKNSLTGVVVWNHVVSGKPTLQLTVGGKIDITVGLDKGKRIAVVGNRGRGEYHLRIKNVKMSDAGRYECMALVGLTRIVKRSAALKVVRPPKPGYPICEMDPAFGLRPGKEVVLSCETMGGIPAATVRWHDGKKALTPSTEGQVSYTHLLTAADFGQTFSCQEITPAYKTPRTCEVIPLEIDLRVDLQPFPRAEVRPGGSATFSCYGQGTNTFSYTWELNDRPLPFSRNIIVFGPNGHKLRIDGITAASNNAKVACVLTNIHGFTARTTSVISVMTPNKPRPSPRVPNPPKPPPNYPIPRPKPTSDLSRPLAPGPTWTTDEYELPFESELGADWGLDPPYEGGNSASSSMTAMASALVGIFIGVLVAVGVIISRKYLKNRDGSIITLINRSHSTSIPSSTLDDQGSGSMDDRRIIFSDGREYDLPPRDYPLLGQEEDSMSYLGLRPESLTSTRSTYQGLNQHRPRFSTYDPSHFSDEYVVGGSSLEYYEDILNEEQRESVYHYRFSPPVDESEIHPRCMSADRSTRHFMAR